MKVNGQLHDPAALPREENVPGTHWIGAHVNPRAGLDAVGKERIPNTVWNQTPVVQPAA
jgi:hypothetical protein